MIEKHPRYKKIIMSNGEIVSFIFFNKDYKLRSHTVKHFLNTYEWEVGWKNICRGVSLQYKDKFNDISVIRTKTYDHLKKINCSYIKENDSAKYTEDDNFCSVCSLFSNKCNYTGITELQTLYVDLIQNSIEKALQIPRYAKFFSFYLKQNSFSGVIEGPVIIRTHLISELEPIYNVMTSFVPLKFGTKLKFADIIEDEIRNIKEDARTYSIDWYTETTWRFDFYSEEKKNKSDKKRNKYDRLSKKNWKNWPDEYCDS